MPENKSRHDNNSPLLCPRCVSQMLPMQRFGVTIDQCTGCGGVFLDRGELETLVEAEGKFYAQQQPAPPPYPTQQYPPADYGPPRRGGFLGQFFGGPGYYGGRPGGHH